MLCMWFVCVVYCYSRRAFILIDFITNNWLLKTHCINDDSVYLQSVQYCMFCHFYLLLNLRSQNPQKRWNKHVCLWLQIHNNLCNNRRSNTPTFTKDFNRFTQIQIACRHSKASVTFKTFIAEIHPTCVQIQWKKRFISRIMVPPTQNVSMIHENLLQVDSRQFNWDSCYYPEMYSTCYVSPQNSLWM